MTEAITILVTGAAGFIGHAVASRLHGAGRGVIGTDVTMPAGHGPDDFTFCRADARDALRHMALLARGCDGVIHCGGVSGPMLASDNPADLLDINIRGTTQLLDLVRVLGLRRLIACSSVSAYGDTGGLDVVAEATPLRASTVYGTSKAASDLVVQTFKARFGLSAAALRIGWVYGPRRMTDGVLRPMIRSALGGPAVEWPRGADQPLQFVHVDDVAAALIAAFDAPALRQAAYNVNGAEVMTVAAIAKTVRTILPAARITIGPGAMDDTDRQGRMVLDAAARDLGWVPRVTLRDGIERYADWLGHHDF